MDMTRGDDEGTQKAQGDSTYSSLLSLLGVSGSPEGHNGPWPDHEVFIGSEEKRGGLRNEQPEHATYHDKAARTDLPDLMKGFLGTLRDVVGLTKTDISEFKGQQELYRNRERLMYWL